MDRWSTEKTIEFIDGGVYWQINRWMMYTWINRLNDGMKDYWMDRWREGGMGDWMDGWMMNRWIDGMEDLCIDIWMYEWVDEAVERQTDV